MYYKKDVMYILSFVTLVESQRLFSKICTTQYVDSAMVALHAPSTTVKTKVHMSS